MLPGLSTPARWHRRWWRLCSLMAQFVAICFNAPQLAQPSPWLPPGKWTPTGWRATKRLIWQEAMMLLTWLIWDR